VESTQRFPETRFSILEQLSSTDEGARSAAYDVLVRAYWQPVYAYVRLRWQLDPADAQDTTQSFLATAWDKGYFESFDAVKARFRTFLRVCLDRFVQKQQKAEHALKRGGCAQLLSLDFAGVEQSLATIDSAHTNDTDEVFRREYVRALFTRAVERLRAELAARGRDIVFAVFDAYDLADDEANYNEIANRLGIPVTQVTNHLHAARRRFRALVLEELRAVSSSELEFQAEAREILGVDIA
jgi:RNA polymerase sigma factor (sigma-70 family)